MNFPITQAQILEETRRQLAIDMSCQPEDFLRDGVVFTEVDNHPGRRPFDRDDPHLEIATMGKGIVVTAASSILPAVKAQLDGLCRDEIFVQPFIYGISLYYLPDLSDLRPLSLAEGYELRVFEQTDMATFYTHLGFPNSVSYDLAHPRPDVLVFAAIKDGIVAGTAGASSDCVRLWQVGMDVLPEYRGAGLAAALVSQITVEILRRGFVPYYGTSVANVPSQRTARRAGYFPAWTSTYRSRYGVK